LEDQPPPEQYTEIEKNPENLPGLANWKKISVQNGKVSVQLKLPLQAVALLVLNWD
jgi:hypothetical protein